MCSTLVSHFYLFIVDSLNIIYEAHRETDPIIILTTVSVAIRGSLFTNMANVSYAPFNILIEIVTEYEHHYLYSVASTQ